MNDQRIERALRGGPPFATRYDARPVTLEPTRTGSRASIRAVAVLALLLAAVSAALTLVPKVLEAPGPQTPATLEQLKGPIQPLPLVVPAGLRTEIERVCRRDPAMPAGAVTVMLDARGGGVAHVWIHEGDPTQRLWSCYVESLDPAISMSGGVGGSYPTTVALRELLWADTQFTSVLGYAGPQIETVRIAVDNGPTVTATRNGPWFAAYWALPPVCPFVAGRHVCPDVHYRAIGLDGFGAVVAEIDWYSPGDAPPGWTLPPYGGDE